MAWSVISDQRDKCCITPLTAGLAELKLFNPKLYKWNPRDRYIQQEIANITNNGAIVLSQEQYNTLYANLEANLVTGTCLSDSNFTTGFIAQEIAQIENSANIGFCSIADKTDSNMLAVRTGQFIPLCVNAIKELDATLSQQANTIAQQANTIALLQTMIASLQTQVNGLLSA